MLRMEQTIEQQALEIVEKLPFFGGFSYFKMIVGSNPRLLISC